MGGAAPDLSRYFVHGRRNRGVQAARLAARSTVSKPLLHPADLVKPAPRRGAHRKQRRRRPMPGMLLIQDASRHAWLDGVAPLDLVVTLDDATSEVYSAFLVEEEGPASSFRGLAEVVAAKGLFCALYTDRGSHYFHTPTAGGKGSRTQPTQVGRAPAQLGIEHIEAYSPEGRDRFERVFRTLQDRLPKELRLAGITDIEAANRWLAEVYLPEHNARFAVPAEQDGSAFVADRTGAWRDILCIQEERLVGNDNTVKWKRLSLQSRRRRCAPTPCAPGCASSNIPVAASPSAGGRTGLPTTTQPAVRATPMRWPPEPFRCQPGCGFVDIAPRSPQPHSRHNHRSGQLMRYKNRPT